MFNDFLIANDIEMVLEKPQAAAYYATFYGTKGALEQMIWDFFNPGSWHEDYPIDYSNDEFASLIYNMERVEEDNGKLREARYLYKNIEEKQITEKDVEQALFILKSLNELADSEKLDFKIRTGIKTSIKNICEKSLSLLKYNKF